jgi:putative NADH-flavin reductase
LEEQKLKITVIGSSSRTGLFVLEQGIRRGHEITAFTRRPQKLLDVTGLKEIVTGDGLNLLDVKKAIHKQDAIIAIVSVNSLGQNSVVTDVTRTIIKAMQEEEVHRLVCVSSYLLEQTRRPWIAPFFQWLLRHPLADQLSADQLIMSSKTDWTIVRPMLLVDKPATGHVRQLRSGHHFESGPYKICREDVAAFLLDVVENKDDSKSIINITWGKNN